MIEKIMFICIVVAFACSVLSLGGYIVSTIFNKKEDKPRIKLEADWVVNIYLPNILVRTGFNESGGQDV